MQTANRRLRRRVKRWRWHATKAAGIHRYTWASLHGIDRRLVELFGHRRGGTFIELGANDGLQQSNTLALEQRYGWRGLLIEPDPELAAECLRNRPDARVVCAAAGATWGLTSLVRDDLMGTVTDASSAARTALVPTSPLSAIIDAAGCGSTPIDLLSVDVEGAELQVLAGLDLDRHQPEHVVVETADRHAVAAALGDRYRWVTQWTSHDHLFSRLGDAP